MRSPAAVRRALGAAFVVLLGTAPASADPVGALDLLRPGTLRAAPEFTTAGLNGRAVSLREQRGKVVLLNFWATWCPPCKAEMPSMERLYRMFKDRGFTILAISIDSAERPRVAQFVAALGLTFPIGLDPTLEVANRYAIRALPSSFLIDRSGQIAAIALGPREWDSQAARAVVETLVQQ